MIVISESIHSASARKVIEHILALDSHQQKEITLFLNSPGGEVSSGFGIYDVMRFIRSPIRVVVSGLAASIATVILLGAPKEHRYALPNSRFLIHQPLIHGSIQGQASDIEIHAKEIIKTREKIARLYEAETHQSLERISRDMERDYWMTATEAKEYGLISKVVQHWKEI